MKRLIGLAVFFLSTCSAFAQTPGTCWAVNENASSVASVTVAATPTGGSGHVLVAYARSGGSTTYTFSDTSGSNIWSAIGSVTGNSNVFAQPGYSANPVGGSYNVTITFGANQSFSAFTVCELSGLVSSSVLDTGVTTVTSTCSFTTSCTSGAFSTTGTNKDMVLYLVTASSTSGYAVGAIGGTTATSITTVANDQFWEYVPFSVAKSSITAAASNSGTLNRWLTFAIAFQFGTITSNTTSGSAFMPGP